LAGGVGAELILDVFGGERVDAFDLDRRMITRAQSRLRGRHAKIRLWIADATLIPVPAATYDAVFDFGILHHVPDWRRALAEVARVLKPGGRFYAMEVLRAVIVHPLVRWLLPHPQVDRFDEPEFIAALRGAGLHPVASQSFSRAFAWVVADRQAAA
jgi:ubiquinone/menaquinone biosynthesis C-methylase UbiE